MLYYENHLAKWLKTHKGYRLDYQVTPLYRNDELLPRQIRLAYVGYNPRGKKLKSISTHTVKKMVMMRQPSFISTMTVQMPSLITVMVPHAILSIKPKHSKLNRLKLKLKPKRVLMRPPLRLQRKGLLQKLRAAAGEPLQQAAAQAQAATAPNGCRPRTSHW